MRALTVAIALILIANTSHAQTPSRDPSRSSQGLGYGGGAGGTGGYGYSTDKGSGSGLHYGGGYIRSDGSMALPQGPHGTQSNTSGTRSNPDSSGGFNGARTPRY